VKGFDATFVDLLLYDNERKALQPYLASLSSLSSSSADGPEVSYARHFGLLHLLRYLVFVIAKESSVSKEELLMEREDKGDKKSERSSRKRRKSDVATTSVASAGTERSKEEILLEEIQLLAIKALNLLATDAFFPLLLSSSSSSSCFP
jgi:hypothetical protein